MARTLEELDAAVGLLEDRVASLETSMDVANRNIAAMDALLDLMGPRLNQLDGQGLADPTLATTRRLSADVEGLKTTVQQVVLVLETDINQTKSTVESLNTLLTEHMSV